MLTAKPTPMFLSLMMLLSLVYSSLQAQDLLLDSHPLVFKFDTGATETNNIKDQYIPVPSTWTFLRAPYFPETTVSKQCDLCHCCNASGNCKATICCNEIICNDPSKPPDTCIGTRTSCGCDVNTCK